MSEPPSRRGSGYARRIPESLEPNALAKLRASLGRVPLDLTVSNPTACGIRYPKEILEPLSRREGLAYLPEPLGIAAAREAVAAEYALQGRSVHPSRVALTASTSEAYSQLFKLLCDPGDAVLVPVPSYPLFEHLAALEGVRAVPYPLDPSGGWQPDLSGLDSASPRAVVTVHPNNPTGTYVSQEAASDLAAFCARNGAARIVDEVFHAYPFSSVPPASSFVDSHEVLTFTLNGLSKHVGLPQLKLAWTVVSGPDVEVRRALERLSFVADQYLSVATPVQLALADLLREGTVVREAIRRRCARNLEETNRAVAAAPGMELVPPQGGWSAVVRFPGVVPEEALALELLEEDGVAVHPGYFFDFPGEGWLAVSLLPDPPILHRGIERIVSRIVSRL